jgi:predicted nucleic acid-binding protein
VIVVDAVVLADFLAGAPPLRAAAVRLTELDPEWISCGLCRYELGNVLWKQVRLGGLDREAALRHLEQAATMLAEVSDQLETKQVLALALHEGLTFYDSSYVWLARSRGVLLYTRDGQILRQCADTARPMPLL